VHVYLFLQPGLNSTRLNKLCLVVLLPVVDFLQYFVPNLVYRLPCSFHELTFLELVNAFLHTLQALLPCANHLPQDTSTRRLAHKVLGFARLLIKRLSRQSGWAAKRADVFVIGFEGGQVAAARCGLVVVLPSDLLVSVVSYSLPLVKFLVMVGVDSHLRLSHAILSNGDHDVFLLWLFRGSANSFGIHRALACLSASLSAN